MVCAGPAMCLGLFLGDAGIGVTMMRVNDPSSIDSPLLAGRRLLGLAGAASNRMEPRGSI